MCAEGQPALPGWPFQRAMRRQAAARRWRCRREELENGIFQEDRRRDAVGPCQFTPCVITCSPARSRSLVPRPPRRVPVPVLQPNPVLLFPVPRRRNSGGVFNMMSGWTGCVYQTAWTLDFASERSDAKSYVRNRQDGPDIMHPPSSSQRNTRCVA